MSSIPQLTKKYIISSLVASSCLVLGMVTAQAASPVNASAAAPQTAELSDGSKPEVEAIDQSDITEIANVSDEAVTEAKSDESLSNAVVSEVATEESLVSTSQLSENTVASSDESNSQTDETQAKMEVTEGYSRFYTAHQNVVPKYGIGTDVYKVTANQHQVTITSWLSYANRDAKGQLYAADKGLVQAYLESEDLKERIKLTVTATDNPYLFELAYDERRLKNNQRYRVFGRVGAAVETLWTSKPFEAATANQVIKMQDNQLIATGRQATGFATDVYETYAMANQGTIKALLTYGTRDSQGQFVPVDRELLTAYLLSKDGQHRIGLTVQATENPRVFNLNYQLSQLRAGLEYVAYATLNGGTQALWTSPAIDYSARTMKATREHNQLVVRRQQLANSATDVYSVENQGNLAKIKALMAFGSRDQSGQFIPVDLLDLSVRLVGADGHSLMTQVLKTENPRIFEIQFDTNTLRQHTVYRVVATIAGVNETLWSGYRLNSYGPRVHFFNQEGTLRVERATVGSGATDTGAISSNGNVTTIRTFLAYGTRLANGQLTPAMLSNLTAYLESTRDGSRVKATLSATDSPYWFNLEYTNTALQKGHAYKVMAQIAEYKENLYIGRNLDYRSGIIKVYDNANTLRTQIGSIYEINNQIKTLVDLSEHNRDVDFEKLKQQVDGVIIRVGFSTKRYDYRWKDYVAQAIQHNIPYGFYWYSYALNEEDAAKEAKMFLDGIKGYKPEYPVFIDMEDADHWKEKQGKQHPANTWQGREAIIKVHANYYRQNGYAAGVYASKSWYDNMSSDLDQYIQWIAHWTEDNRTYKHTKYAMHQYSSKGKVEGMPTVADMNVTWLDFPTMVRKQGLNGWTKS